jgi:hypothetical protein
MLNIALKAKYSFYSTLVFFLVANPETYKMMHWAFQSIFGTIASSAGCPTTVGFFLSTFLFFVVMFSLMMFPRD